MNLTAIAIDDEPDALELIRMHAAKVPFLTLEKTFTNAFSGIGYLQTKRVDLLFLDIKMPDISGIELVNSLPVAPMVIFTTAYSQYAVEGFELRALDYLLKPFSLARFTLACNRAAESKSLRNTDPVPYLFVKTGYAEEKVMLGDILYLEADGNYITIVLPQRQVLTRQSVTELLTALPANRFVRIHRSYAVAIDKIEKISRQEIVVAGKNIPVGSSYETQLAEIRSRLNFV
ncbi:LytR/AlgR family response regulator transcription factor [Hufsiella ginkgonis]|uniref:Response regulator n=1 Tax=Hufsiella ginkgonis TaxID=2695274 RepID=A0A7K1XVM6_9SPHI|nr:LytTR family DNA-binding domain-containing protein [Hufsiella ginkgonis]MXV14867.1 response regulator [Hufsiella ginkgonis]